MRRQYLKKMYSLCYTAQYRVLGCFSSKVRTSLKTRLLFCFFEHFKFPTFSLLESCSQTTNFQKTVYILAFHHLLNLLILHFASLLDVVFLQCGHQKYIILLLFLLFYYYFIFISLGKVAPSVVKNCFSGGRGKQ